MDLARENTERTSGGHPSKNATSTEVWFLRSGCQFDPKEILCGTVKRFPGAVEIKNKDCAVVSENRFCSRCGGQGGSQKWDHTGWTCYQCGGSCFGPARSVKLYSSSKLEQLNKARDKRRTTLAKQREKQRLALEQERALRKESMLAHNTHNYPEAMAVLTDYQGDNPFLVEIKSLAIGGEELSKGQAEAVLSVWNALQEKNRWDTLVSTIEENRQAAPHGRIEVSGYILSAKWYEQSFQGRSNHVIKILMIDDRGFKLWTTAPKGLSVHMKRDEEGYLIPESARKLRIKFKATIEPKSEDPYFAFGKRPGKCELLRVHILPALEIKKDVQ